VRAELYLAQLQSATRRAIDTDDWGAWKAFQDEHFTYALKASMTRAQRIRLHELLHGFTILADPDGTWSDRLSERLEREYRASLVSSGS